MTHLEYEFQGKKYIVVEGGLTTPFDFEHGYVSYAHVIGEWIMRFGTLIGKRADLIPTGRAVEANLSPEAYEAILSGHFVPRPSAEEALGVNRCNCGRFAVLYRAVGNTGHGACARCLEREEN